MTWGMDKSWGIDKLQDKAKLAGTCKTALIFDGQAWQSRDQKAYPPPGLGEINKASLQSHPKQGRKM